MLLNLVIFKDHQQGTQQKNKKSEIPTVKKDKKVSRVSHIINL